MTQANFEDTLFESSARTATATSRDLNNHNYRYLTLFVDVSADSGEDVTPRVEMKEIVAETYTPIWTAAAAISATGEFNYQLGPGLVAGTSEGYDDTGAVVIPKTFRVVMSHASTVSITYSVTYSLSV